MTRISRSVLLHEAMDDLLEKHRIKWSLPLEYGLSARSAHRAGIKPRTPK